MAINWADPLHIKSKYLSQIPGVSAIQNFADHNAAGRFFLENPIESFLPREYQISSPWAGMQADKDKIAEDQAKNQQEAWSKLANDEG